MPQSIRVNLVCRGALTSFKILSPLITLLRIPYLFHFGNTSFGLSIWPKYSILNRVIRVHSTNQKSINVSFSQQNQMSCFQNVPAKDYQILVKTKLQTESLRCDALLRVPGFKPRTSNLRTCLHAHNSLPKSQCDGNFELLQTKQT